MGLLRSGLITAMQFFETQEVAQGKYHGESTNRLPGGENLRRQWICVFILIVLLHVMLIAYLHRSSEPETPAKPLVMDVALIAAPAPPQAKPVPPAPPVVQPKPQPKPVKAKKAPVTPKKIPVIRKPDSLPAPTPEPAPMAKPKEAAPSPAPITPVPPRPAVAPVAPAQPKTETFTEANYRANYKSNPKPEYPRIARSRGWQGKVLLRVQVTADGHSADVSVLQSSGHELLDDAAIEAVRKWTFIPAKRGNTPVASTVTVPMQFKLNE